MRGQTRKHKLDTFLGQDHDATIYTSGGSQHTVEIEDIDTGSRVFKTFTGPGARDRAYAYAKQHTNPQGGA